MELTKQQLQKMYETMSNKALAKKLGVTEPTLTATIKRLGIKPKGSGNRNKKSKIKIIG